MDLVLPEALPSDDERAAVDAVLGAAASGWAGGQRAIEFEGTGREGRRRGPRPTSPAPTGAPRPAGARRVDQPGRAPLRVRAAHRSARRGIRGRDLLRDVLGRAATADRAPRLRRHRLQGGGRRGSHRRSRARARVRAEEPDHQEPVSRHVRTGTCGLDADVRRGRERCRDGSGLDGVPRSVPARRSVGDRVRRRGRRAPTARPRYACSAVSGSSIRPRSTITGRTAATRRCGGPSSSDRRAWSASSRTRSSSAAAVRPSRPASSGRPSPSSPSGPTTSCATRTSPSPGPSRTAC